MQETMMLGLRLVKEGVSARLFAKRYGESIMAVFGKEITDLLGLNLLEWQGDQLILTQRGRLLGNQVFIRFI
jgi:oxygen-independent coproporphyrinogen-3 oxidase